MLHRLAADLVVLSHLLFIVFVIVGGFLAWRWRWLPWFHIPAAAWGAFIELANWACPLTPLENWLRRGAGQTEYESSFIEHYIVPIIYPGELPRGVQVALGVFVVFVNVFAYAGYLKGRSSTT